MLEFIHEDFRHLQKAFSDSNKIIKTVLSAETKNEFLY